MAYTTIDKPTDYFNTVLYTGMDRDWETVWGTQKGSTPKKTPQTFLARNVPPAACQK